MTEETKPVGDGNQDGNSVAPGSEGKPDDMVKYDTYRKAVTESKKRQEKLVDQQKLIDDYAAADKKRDEENMVKNEEWQKVIQVRDEELAAARAENVELKTTRSNAMKLQSFLSTIDGVVDEPYWGLINIENIATDPTTGKIDEMTVAQEVERFKKVHWKIVEKPGTSTGMPNEAPQGKSTLTRADWLKLPAKEMAERMQEARANEEGNT